jgi:hypothetical protein
MVLRLPKFSTASFISPMLHSLIYHPGLVQWTHLQYDYQGILSHPTARTLTNILSWRNCLPRSSKDWICDDEGLLFEILLDYFMLSPLSILKQAVALLTCILRYLLESHPWHPTTWLRFLVVFFSPSKQMPRWNLSYFRIALLKNMYNSLLAYVHYFEKKNKSRLIRSPSCLCLCVYSHLLTSECPN